jgi:hypothetical protein
VAGSVEGLVEAGSEEAGFEASTAEHRLLGEGDAFKGEGHPTASRRAETGGFEGGFLATCIEGTSRSEIARGR